MAYTSYGVNDALAVKLWAKGLSREVSKATEIAPLIGGKDSIIWLKDEASKGPGDRITCGLRMLLSGDGFTEGETAEGNGESLTTYSDDLFINELGHVVGVESENTIDQQRVPFNLREEARDGLSTWWGDRMAEAFFNQVCGNTAQSNTKRTGLNAALAPSTNRVLRQAGQSDDQSLTTNDTFTLDLIDNAKELAKTATPKIRPLKMMGRDMYVIYLHEYQVTDLRTNTNTGQWLDIQKAAMQGGQVTKNPIFTSALGVYNDVIIRESNNVTQGVHSSTGAAVSTVRRAPFLGAQSCAMAFGRRGGPSRYRWNEELLDHKRKLEVSAWSIHGLKKLQFNSEDFGTIVVSTYAAAHTS